MSAVGHDITTNALVELPLQGRRLGTYIVGGNGRGKTQLIEHLVVADIEAGRGVCLLDPHRDLTNQVLARVPERRRGDIILLDVLDREYPFGLNLCETTDSTDEESVYRTVSSAMHIFDKLFGVSRTDTARLARFLRNCLYTLAQNPGMTILELPRLLSTLPQDTAFRQRLLVNVTSPDVHRFWRTYEGLRDQIQEDRNESTYNRVEELILNPTVRHVVGQGRSTIDFRAAMDAGKIVLVQLAAEQRDLTTLVGSIVVARLLGAVLSREEIKNEAARRLFMVYADEFQRFATEDFATLFSEARKYQVALTVAHQYRDQLDEANQGATLQVENYIVFAVSGPDSQVMAGQFDATPVLRPSDRTQPVLTLSPNPVKHLLAHGHKHPELQEYVQRYLKPLGARVEQLERLERSTRQDLQGRRVSMLGGAEERLLTRLRNGLQNLDSMFFNTMNQATRNSADVALTTLASLALVYIDLRDAFGEIVFWASLGRSNEYTIKPEYGELADLYLTYLFNKPIDETGRKPTIENVVDRYIEKITSQPGDYSELRWVTRAALQGGRDFVDATIRALALLLQHPILVDSGQVEVVQERRTVADMRADIANMLVNLDRFIARVKFGTKEYSVRTLPPVDEEKLPSKSWRPPPVGRERREVDQEIRERQGDDGEDPPRRSIKPRRL